MRVDVTRGDDERWMRLALDEAAVAAENGEVPVGAVIVQGAECIAVAHNQPILSNDPGAHAEMLVLRRAGAALDNYRLSECTLYVTLEPCTMCAGAMIHARIKRLVFAASDPKTGAAGSVFNVLNDTRHNHQVEVESGVFAREASMQLQSFFKARR